MPTTCGGEIAGVAVGRERRWHGVGWQVQARVLAQHRRLELTQANARVDAQLVLQQRPHPLVRRQCLALPSRAVQGQDELLPQRLAVGVRDRELGELPDELAFGTAAEVGFDPVFDRAEPLLAESGCYLGGKPMVLQVRERGSGPLGQSQSQQPRGFAWISVLDPPRVPAAGESRSVRSRRRRRLREADSQVATSPGSQGGPAPRRVRAGSVRRTPARRRLPLEAGRLATRPR